MPTPVLTDELRFEGLHVALHLPGPAGCGACTPAYVRFGSESVKWPKPGLSQLTSEASLSRSDGPRPHCLETPEKTKARICGPCSVSLVNIASELCWRLYECDGPSSGPVFGRSRSVDTLAICQKIEALPVARAESIAASTAGVSTSRITFLVAPSSIVSVSHA